MSSENGGGGVKMRAGARVKGFVCLFVSVVLCLSLFASCGGKKSYKFYVPDGAPVLSIAGFWSNKTVKIGGENVKIELTTGANIRSDLQAKADIAIAPINVCAQSYNSGEGFVFAGTAVWGLTYLVSRTLYFPIEKDMSELKPAIDGYPLDPPASFNNLLGEVIYAFQENMTAGLTLKAILKAQSVPFVVIKPEDEAQPLKVNIVFMTGPLDVRNAMLNGYGGKPANQIKFGIMTEPQVTALVGNKDNGLVRIFDMQKLWGETSYPQAGLIIKKSIADAKPEFVAALLEKMSASYTWVTGNSQNAANKAKNDIKSSELSGADSIKAFIEGTGKDILKFTKSKDCSAAVKDYLKRITDGVNLNVVGGKLPDDGFYL